jgi:hypothetical protein
MNFFVPAIYVPTFTIMKVETEGTKTRCGGEVQRICALRLQNRPYVSLAVVVTT